MPTSRLSRHRQQWEEVDIGCVGAVSFSDSSSRPKARGGVPSSREDRLSDLHCHRNLLILHWEKHLQVKDFRRDCSNSGDSFHLYSAAMQSNQSLVSVHMARVVLCIQDRAKNPTSWEVGTFLGTKVLPSALSAFLQQTISVSTNWAEKISCWFSIWYLRQWPTLIHNSILISRTFPLWKLNSNFIKVTILEIHNTWEFYM